MQDIFDIEKIRKNREWARTHMAGHDFLFKAMASRLVDSLDDIQRDFYDIAMIGERGANLICQHKNFKNSVIYDVVNFKDEFDDLGVGQFDCIISPSYLHCVNDVPGFLSMVKRALKPDGVFLCSLFGGQSLNELRQSIMQAQMETGQGVSPQIHPMIDHYQMAGLMQRAGFALPVVDVDTIHVTYSDLNNLYADLKNMGEGNALTNREGVVFPIRDGVERFYRTNFYDQGYQATFDLVYAIGWAPHESQQQPAKRGSGQVSLTEIL